MKKQTMDTVVSKLLAAETDFEVKAALRDIEIQHTSRDYVVPRIDGPKLHRFRKLYAEMLYEKELAAAKRMIAEQEEPIFYKASDYERRARFEYGTASILLDRSVSSIAYVGSGPFPATAIFAARNGMKVTLVDRSEEALSLSEQVAAKCDVVCTHVLGEAEHLDNLDSVDLVVISGTVGIEESDKRAVCEHLLQELGENGLVCVRTPVREETLLMAPTPVLSGVFQADAYIETAADYMNRTFLAKRPDAMKGWI